MKNLSSRVLGIPESATLSMASKAREMRQKGEDVISLSLGEPDFKTPEFIQQKAIESIHSGKYFSYPPVPGYLDLREAISDKFKRENQLDYASDQILVSNGAKQSIANVMLSILNPRDEVIVFTPYWVSYEALILLAEGIPVYLSGLMDKDFKVTSDQLEKAITKKTKAIIYSSPCNPTGSVFSKDELKSIADVIKKHPNITVIADEIYEHINFVGHESIAAMDNIIDQTVTVNGFSKGFAMTGWRVGYIGAPSKITKAAEKIQGQVTSANCSIAQRAAYASLTEPSSAPYEMCKEYLRRREIVYNLLNDISGLKVNKPEGAFYFFPDVRSYFGKGVGNYTIKNSNDLCMYLLREAKVSLVCGDAFGAPNNLRLSYAASEENLRIAIERIKEQLIKLN